MKNEKTLQRHTVSERCNHWIVAITFILTALSGLSFFHPSLYPLSVLFGGGTWARILHPFLALVLVISFVIWFLRIRKDNRFIKNDFQWAGHIFDLLRNRTESLPPVGKYNFGQKILTHVLLFFVFLLLVSGIMLWQPWFADSFTISLRRFAAVVHALAAFGAVLFIIIHIYAAYWTTGAIPSMITGVVSKKWAKHHSPLWYKKYEQKIIEDQRGLNAADS